MLDGNCIMVILHYGNHNGFMKPEMSINGLFKNLENVRRKNKDWNIIFKLPMVKKLVI